MEKVTVDLRHCYGIKNLNHQFDFTKKRAFAVYAPNGAMKSSFAQTFKDISLGTTSSDRIFPSRITSRIVTDESGADLPQGAVLVVVPYDEQVGHNEKTSTLLVDAVLKAEYDQLNLDRDKAKEALLKAIKQQASSKKDFETEISFAFTNEKDFYKAITRIQKEIEEQMEAPFSDVRYDVIFDEKVQTALTTKAGLTSTIEEYVQRYNELLAASTFFKRGVFDYYNAGQIATSLAKNGFFAAKHTVSLVSTGERVEINTEKELEDVIAREKEAIFHDKKLRMAFDAMAKILHANTNLRDFETYLMANEALVAQLSNINKFKEDILKSYIKVHFDLYVDLITKFESAKARREEIEAEARKQQAQWDSAIEIFNSRFFVPFTLEATNRVEVILGVDAMIDLGFTYHDGSDKAKIEKGALLKSLSTGERKAFYILNVIFEIETRRKASQETLIIVDDIADSFDYQNKYAIIQYLKDNSDDGLFKQIIMTHNFDFFRTVESRFVGYNHCLMASKTSTGISLEKAVGIRNIFINDWKGKFFTDAKKRIASIPFLRNLIEYTHGDSDPDYMKLTSLLHWLPTTSNITVTELDTIFNGLCKCSGKSANGPHLVSDEIFKEAQSCMTAPTSINLENKIVLAIAIRLHAERFMVTKINDPAFIEGIKSDQTPKLVGEFRKKFSAETATIKALDLVILMTPENIHLNSFMYEPIIDMSDEHLRSLYKTVSALF